jgi:hypothetical protein
MKLATGDRQVTLIQINYVRYRTLILPSDLFGVGTLFTPRKRWKMFDGDCVRSHAARRTGRLTKPATTNFVEKPVLGSRLLDFIRNAFDGHIKSPS